MTHDHSQDLDRIVRRAAHESIEKHRASIGRDETESALHSTRNMLDGSPVREHRRRRLVGVSAAATLVALVGALVVVSGNRNEQDSDVPSPSDAATAVDIPATDLETSGPPSIVPTDVGLPSSAFDTDGSPLSKFLGDQVDVAQSGFVEVLYDYLVNRSDILGDSVAEREQLLAVGGLRIHTTLDPDAQTAAVAAHAELPANSAGFDAAMVSIDTDSGAVRALSGAPREESSDGHVNMAVTPRQTGSAIRLFIVAAAFEVGVLGDDTIDSRLPCQFPLPDPDAGDFAITNGVSGDVGPIRDDVVAMSLVCGTARLGHIVGLQTIVDTTLQMAASAYLDPTNSDPVHSQLEPVASLTTGSNELSALDMASGMQTIANEGIHHAPYFVEYIDDADGNRVYTHSPDGHRVLDADTSLETIDALKGGVANGSTGRRAVLNDNRPAIGVTGTTMGSANAWFIGATPQLTTAVWVGDPNAYTPMIDTPEFVAAGYGSHVQGGGFPAVIWKTFTDTAHSNIASTDWATPPAPARPAARLVLPGVECRGGDPTNPNRPQQIDPQQPVTTVDPSTQIVACE